MERQLDSEQELRQAAYGLVIGQGKTHCFKGKQSNDAWVGLVILRLVPHDRLRL